MDKICAYPKCQKCEYEYCIKDGQISLNLPPKSKDRREYQHRYYEEHKARKSAYYTSKSHYINKRDIKSSIRKLQGQIGKVNADIVLQTIDQLNTVYK